MKRLGKLLRNAKGATAIEYAMVAALIAIAAVAAFQGLGDSINATFTEVKENVDG